MDARQFDEKWGRISRVANEAETTGPLAIVSVRFDKYEEVQVEIPRIALPELRRDALSIGGVFHAILV